MLQTLKFPKNDKKSKKKGGDGQEELTENKLGHLITSPGLELILNASLVLNSTRARRKRIYFLNRSRTRQKFNFSQQFLRVSFIILIAIALVLSLTIVTLISQIFIDFNYQCILCSDFSLKLSSQDIEVDEKKNVSQFICTYSISIGIIVVSYCIISLFFFIMFNMKRLADSDFFLLVPWLTLTTICTALVFVSTILISNGFANFCQKISSLNGRLTCQSASIVVNEELNVINENFYVELIICTVCSWILGVIMLLIDINVLIRILFIYRNHRLEMKMKLSRNF